MRLDTSPSTEVWGAGQEADAIDETTNGFIVIADEHTAKERELRGRDDLNEHGFSERRDELRQRSQERIVSDYQAAQRKREGALQAARSAAAEALRGRDAQEATLLELQLTNGWQRAQALLDKGTPAEVIDEFRDDPTVLRALHANLPTWLRVRLQSSRPQGLVDNRAQEVEAERQTRKLIAKVEDALARHMSTEYREAIRQVRRLEQQGDALETAFHLAWRQTQKGEMPATERIRLAYARNSGRETT